MSVLVTLGDNSALGVEKLDLHRSTNTTRSVRKLPHARRARRSDAEGSQLVRRAAAGDQRAWDELIDEFTGLVWGIARGFRLSEADAADVSQTTWLRLVENLDRLQDPSRVGAWLATTARRQCIQHLNDTSRMVLSGAIPNGLSEQVSDAPAPHAALLSNERDAALWSALERLPHRDRALLRMLTADAAPSYAEISAALAMPVGSIGRTRARALERLRREVQRSGRTDVPESDRLRYASTPDRGTSYGEIANPATDSDPPDRPSAAVQQLRRKHDAVGRRRRVGVMHEPPDLILRLVPEEDTSVISCQLALQRRERPVAFRASLSLCHRIACCRDATDTRFAQLRQQTRTLVPVVVARRGPRETRAGPSRRCTDSQAEDAEPELVCREVEFA